MKKLYALLLFVVSAGMLNAQYYLLPAYDVGFNPGELNSDPEQTEASLASGSYGWTTIMNSTTTDTWSSSQALPFSFNFNGNAVTSYQVSNAGVLTFSSSPGMAPPTTPSALPSVLLPDKSICAWGINIGGANDAILSKTFGTAPNRQHWVFFSSASHPALGAGSWTYWGIVLEESTDKIYVVDQRTYSPTGTANVAVTVGIQTSVGSVIQVPSSPNVSSGTTATGGSGDDPSDNTWYEFAFGTQANYDIAGVGHTIPQLVQTGSANSLTLKFRNRGAFNINSMDLNYRINGGAAVTTSLSSLNIGSGDFYEIAHPTAWTPPTDAFYTIEAWASNLNGNSDGVNSNDTITIQVRAVANPPERIVVIEEKTGTWCGWCPRGLIGMDYMTTQYPNSVVGIAVHNADPMVVGTYDANIGTVAPGGYPGSAVDRILGPDPNNVDLEDAYNERQGVLPQATVGISGLTYNATNGQISVDVSAEFFADFNNADLRFVMVLTEDSVTGSSSGYAQANYYSFQSQNIALTGYGRNWQTSPSTIPASEMHYDHVARGIYPNFFGAAGSVPANVSFGQTVSYTMNANLPNAVQSDSRVHVVVMLVDNGTYEVLNSKSVKLKGQIGNEELSNANVLVYPNPAADHFYVNAEAMGGDVSINLVNSIGQVVRSSEHESSEVIELNTSDLGTGVYILTIESDDESYTQRISIVR